MKQIHSKKGISPIIATLLLILIAIAAGVVVYAYVLGFVGNSTTPSSQSSNLSVDKQSISASTSVASLFVRNLGSSATSIAQVFQTNPDGSVNPIGDTLYGTLVVSFASGTTISSFRVTDLEFAASTTFSSSGAPSQTNVEIMYTGTFTAITTYTVTLTLYWGNLMFGGSQTLQATGCTAVATASPSSLVPLSSAFTTGCTWSSSNKIIDTGTTTAGSAVTGSAGTAFSSDVKQASVLALSNAAGSATTQLAAPETTSAFGTSSTVTFATITPGSVVQMSVASITNAVPPVASTITAGQVYGFKLVTPDGSSFSSSARATG